ncbi:hypothetical protein CSPX01_07046 [Colletotrichum filicis]|nr:hypothetical protein CSPX01_07046 [Colletotrichum filicis]
MSLVLLRSPTPKPARIIGSKRPPIVYPPRLSSTYQPPNSYTLPHTDANEARSMLARSTDALTALHAPNHTIDAQTHRHHHTAPDAYSLGRLFIGQADIRPKASNHDANSLSCFFERLRPPSPLGIRGQMSRLRPSLFKLLSPFPERQSDTRRRTDLIFHRPCSLKAEGLPK